VFNLHKHTVHIAANEV